jgi:hypothetical protein
MLWVSHVSHVSHFFEGHMSHYFKSHKNELENISLGPNFENFSSVRDNP